MRMLRAMFRTLCFTVAVLISVSTAGALEEGQSGIGFFGSAHVPMGTFKQWYSVSPKLGVSYNYAAAQRVIAEIEYHYSKMGGGDLDSREFTWAVDKKNYRSPNASQNMWFHSFSATALVHFRDLNQGGTMPYLQGGLGFYGYSHEVSGLIFSGQTGQTLNQTLLLSPYKDKRAALTFSLGGGVTIVGSEHYLIDIRGRFNIMLGELRPLEDWRLRKAFPLQALDLIVGVKYFW